MTLPYQGTNSLALRPEMLLLLCYYNPYTSAVIESIDSLQKKSIFPITVLNLFEHGHKKKAQSLAASLRPNFFAGVMIHSTFSNRETEFSSFRQFLNSFTGIKITLEHTDNLTSEQSIQQLDNQILKDLKENLLLETTVFTSNKSCKNVLLLAAHDPIKDPRLDWVAKGAPQEITIIQAGTSLPNNCILKTADQTLTLPQTKWKKGHFNRLFGQANLKNHAGAAGIQELLLLESILDLSEKKFCAMLGAPIYNMRNMTFRSYLQYILQTAASLLDQTSNISGLHAIIATDLPTLPTALILKGLFNIPILYDAHEYWPEQDVASYEYEQQFWSQMERRLVAHVDYCQTVSTGLAKIMSEHYQKTFEVVPNCVPLKDIESIKKQTPEARSCEQSATTQCRFIYQGCFAPERGLDLLIQAWPETNKQAILLLRGPDSSYKNWLINLAKKTGLLGQRIVFPPPVNEHELVNALADGDVGLIPYTPYGTNYRHCCPNKLSQYMAAQLPILANDTQFVKSILAESQAGIVADFSHPQHIVATVDAFIEDPARRIKMGENAYHFAINSFNWEKVSVGFYDKLVDLTAEKQALELVIFPTRRQSSYYRFQPQQNIAKSKLTIFKCLKWLWHTGAFDKIKKLHANHLRTKFS